MRKLFCLTMILLTAMIGSTFADQIRVDEVAIGSNNGSSWTNAYNHLQDALTAASDGDEIWVAGGFYRPDLGNRVSFGSRTESFRLKNGVAIYGGFPSGGGQWEDRNPTENETILSGDLNRNDSGGFTNYVENSYHVVIGSDTDETAILDGFTITGGNANGGYIGPESMGGGMYNEYGNPMLRGCVFRVNLAYFGGGMCNESSNPTLIGCAFSENFAMLDDGGGIHNRFGSSPTLNNCIFEKNQAADDGGGICNSSSSCSPKVTNCIFYENYACGKGGGMYSWGGMATLTNCILWGNMNNGTNNESAQVHTDEGLPSINYNCIQGWTGALGGVGNIGSDPCFVDAYESNYLLKSETGRWDSKLNQWVLDDVTSPCIDAGDPDSDRAEELWPHGMRINMGAWGGTKQASMSVSDAGNIADLNADGIVDYDDVKLVSDGWLCQGALVCEDLNRNGCVNSTDFAIFAKQWLWEYQEPDPGDCEAVVELRRLINEEYSYWQLRGVDWDALFDLYAPAMNEAQTSIGFAQAAANLLVHSEDPHVYMRFGSQYFSNFTTSIELNYNINLLPTLVPQWRTHNSRVSSGRFPGDIGYILINNWALPEDTLDAVFDALDYLSDTQGLIIDVRTNSGGSETLAKEVAGCFLDVYKLYAKQRYRDISEPNGFTQVYSRYVAPNTDHPRYTGQVAVLMGQKCMSSCEAFLLMMKQVPGCVLMGETSYGSSGNPQPHDLFNGVSVYLPCWLAMRPNETCFEGEGIFPHITVEATQQELLTHDPVLDAALLQLRGY